MSFGAGVGSAKRSAGPMAPSPSRIFQNAAARGTMSAPCGSVRRQNQTDALPTGSAAIGKTPLPRLFDLDLGSRRFDFFLHLFGFGFGHTFFDRLGSTFHQRFRFGQ